MSSLFAQGECSLRTRPNGRQGDEGPQGDGGLQEKVPLMHGGGKVL